MNSHPSRRSILALAGSLGLAHQFGASTPAAAQTAKTKIGLQGWGFEPQVVEANIQRFLSQNPDLSVEYTPLDTMLYTEKMLSLFGAGAQADVLYVRDSFLGAWVEAGWLRPIDGMPGLDELNQHTFPFFQQSATYKGKQYGLPYYGDPYLYLYDREALKKIGIDRGPVTLDELKNGALEAKKAGLSNYPILSGLKANPNGLNEFWSLVYASGGHLFDEAMDPVYPDKDTTALGVLEWIVEAMNTWKILDPSSLEFDETQVRDVFISGQGVFTTNTALVLYRANNPQFSKRAGTIDVTRYPGLNDVGAGPMGLTRTYGMSAATKHTAEAWRLMYYLGGKDKEGQFYTAKEWFLKYGLGYAFRDLAADPEVQKTMQRSGFNVDIYENQQKTARVKENVSATWYTEWDLYTQEQVQLALLRRVSAKEALRASAKKAQDLKKRDG